MRWEATMPSPNVDERVSVRCVSCDVEAVYSIDRAGWICPKHRGMLWPDTVAHALEKGTKSADCEAARG